MPKWLMPHGDAMASLSPELALIGAVLHQAIHDVRSPHATIRADACAFLTDPQQIRFWCHLGGLEVEVFQEAVAALLRPPREA
jgi:hypothetical protein